MKRTFFKKANVLSSTLKKTPSILCRILVIYPLLTKFCFLEQLPLKCGCYKKSFIMNDFLKNPYFLNTYLQIEYPKRYLYFIFYSCVDPLRCPDGRSFGFKIIPEGTSKVLADLIKRAQDARCPEYRQNPSRRDRVHSNENFAEINPV